MNKYNPHIHHRRSIRLKGYDYSQAGLYFITICTQNRQYMFGNITNGIMKLNNAGVMVQKWYHELENKFADIKNHEMIIMPNHFHCIIENTGSNAGADLRVCPNNPMTNKNILVENGIIGEHTTMGEYIGSPLHRVVQWFKTMTTNEYIRNVKSDNWQRFDGKLWQRNYWERIIRNENEYLQISKYIIENPMKWENDKLRY